VGEDMKKNLLWYLFMLVSTIVLVSIAVVEVSRSGMAEYKIVVGGNSYYADSYYEAPNGDITFTNIGWGSPERTIVAGDDFVIVKQGK
jgi:hypothetical protein